MRPVGKCAHCGADTFLGSLVIGPGLLGSQPVYCATEGCVSAAFSEGLGPAVQQATLVEILPTRIWVESDIMGGRHVMCQHEGMEPFEYASFHYSYAYTSNAGTWSAAHNLALALGASEPVEERQRSLPPMPTADEVRRQIESLQSLLASLESA